MIKKRFSEKKSSVTNIRNYCEVNVTSVTFVD